MFQLTVPHERSDRLGEIDEIVLADDDVEQRASISALARSLEIAVRMAPANPQTIARDGYPRARAILIDQHFGGTDRGLAYAEQLRTPPNVVVIVLTYDRSIDVRMAVAKVSQLVLYKPVSLELLASALNRADALIAQQAGETPAAIADA